MTTKNTNLMNATKLSYEEIKQTIAQSVLDNFNNESNKDIEDWVQDTYPDFDISINTDMINKNTKIADMLSNIITINNEMFIEDEDFEYDEINNTWNMM